MQTKSHSHPNVIHSHCNTTIMLASVYSERNGVVDSAPRRKRSSSATLVRSRRAAAMAKAARSRSATKSQSASQHAVDELSDLASFFTQLIPGSQDAPIRRTRSAGINRARVSQWTSSCSSSSLSSSGSESGRLARCASECSGTGTNNSSNEQSKSRRRVWWQDESSANADACKTSKHKHKQRQQRQQRQQQQQQRQQQQHSPRGSLLLDKVLNMCTAAVAAPLK